MMTYGETHRPNRRKPVFLGALSGIPNQPTEIIDGRTDWQELSNCTATDAEAFSPTTGESQRMAKKVCAACVVETECLSYALAEGIDDGIWGGLSAPERRRLKEGTK